VLDSKSFRQYAHQLVDWMADYLDEVESYPVLSRQKPGELLDQLPDEAPSEAESMDAILEDMEELILPGLTHWQSPHFYAYFPANSSYPSLMAEMLMATFGVNTFSWITSPAGTELEERMMDWLAKLIGIPESWSGVIQSTASEASLVALLTARERASDFSINEKGYHGEEKFRVYGSEQLHSSIEKAVKIAGMGRENYVKVKADETFAMEGKALCKAISPVTDVDRAHGLIHSQDPVCKTVPVRHFRPDIAALGGNKDGTGLVASIVSVQIALKLRFFAVGHEVTVHTQPAPPVFTRQELKLNGFRCGVLMLSR